MKLISSIWRCWNCDRYHKAEGNDTASKNDPDYNETLICEECGKKTAMLLSRRRIEEPRIEFLEKPNYWGTAVKIEGKWFTIKDSDGKDFIPTLKYHPPFPLYDPEYIKLHHWNAPDETHWNMNWYYWNNVLSWEHFTDDPVPDDIFEAWKLLNPEYPDVRRMHPHWIYGEDPDPDPKTKLDYPVIVGMTPEYY